MKNCEECNDNCSIKGGFGIVLRMANDELKTIHENQEEMSPEVFWGKIDSFYLKYPECIITALDEVIMYSYSSNEKNRYLNS